MSKIVTFQQLQSFLQGLGFEGRSSRGAHMIFEHTKTGTVVTLPNKQGPIRPIYLRTAMRQILNAGIATEFQIRNKLDKAA